MKNLAMFLICSLLTLGCATSYQHQGFMGGFTDNQITTNSFRILFKGNGFTSQERTYDFALLRACELTIQNGYRYFSVVDQNNETDVAYHETPGYSSTYGSFRRGHYYSSTFYTPPTSYEIVRPRSGLVIECYLDRPNSEVFEAISLQQILKVKYGIE